MASPASRLASLTAVGNAAPEQRQLPQDANAAARALFPAPDAPTAEIAPPVTISASAIAIKVGDRLIGTLIGPDADGRRYFVAVQGTFSVEPQAAMEGLHEATLLVTRTDRGIEAVLLTETEVTADLPQLKLQLVEANIGTRTPSLDASGVVAADNPVTLAEAIAISLSKLNLPLPQAFMQEAAELPAAPRLTPQDAAIAAVVLQPLRTPPQMAPLLQDAPEPAAQNPLNMPAQQTPAAVRDDQNPEGVRRTALPDANVQPAHDPVPRPQPLGAGTSVKLMMDSPPPSGAPLRDLSVLLDIPDDPAARRTLLQSPLLAALVREDRLVLLATGAAPSTAPALLLPASPAQGTEPPLTALLQTAEGKPLTVGNHRLVLLVTTPHPDMATRAENWPLLAGMIPEAGDRRALAAWSMSMSLPIRSGMPAPAPAFLPELGPDLPAEILLLFHAAGRKTPAPVLKRLAALRYEPADVPGTEQTSLLQTLRTLARPLSQSAAADDAPERLVLPLQVDSLLIPMVAVFGAAEPPADGTPQERTSADTDGPWQTFSLAIEFDALGLLRLRGRCDSRQIELVVETAAALPEALQASAGRLYFDTLEAASLQGTLRFQSLTEQGWQSPAAPL